MLAELTSIVETCLGIPVAVSPAAVRIRDWPSDVLLAEHFLTIHERSHVVHTRTETVLAVLASRIVRVVRALDLEVQALRQETHVELVLEVEVQHVHACVLIA